MKISIVTISYNQAKFLERAILSVIEQDYHDIEYIVVDPGSTDGSRDIINKYNDKIKKIIFEPDKGPADGLNKGFASATGNIFGYINADDYFDGGAFSYVDTFFQVNPETDVLTGAIRLVDRKEKPKIRKRTADRFGLKLFAAGTCMVGQQATFFRQEAFQRSGGFNIHNHTCWDAELLVDMALAGCSFNTVYKILGNFRIHGMSISGSGRLNREYRDDRMRIRDKIKREGIVLFPVWMEAVQRFFYKINILRHIAYITVR
jgi:glycosyltransferase involved in cell wall biosynthesis